jgi:hypothetical protein
MRIESKPIAQEFALKSDPDGEAKVTFRQATFDEMRRREEYFSQQRKTTIPETGGQVVEDNLNMLDLYALEIWMTLVGISGIVDASDQPFFKFRDDNNGLQKPDYSKENFIKRLGQLPPDMVYEMRECTCKVNPQFLPQWARKQAEVDEETGE